MNKKRGWFLGCFILFLLVLSLGKGIDSRIVCDLRLDSDSYCQEIPEEEAEEGEFSTKGCEEITECDPILCTFNCLNEARGECLAEGGKEIDEINEFFNDWCSNGCCSVGSGERRFCEFVYKKQECLDKALARGLVGQETWIPSMNRNTCLAEVCGREISPAILTGHVYDEDQEPLGGVLLEIEGIATFTTAADGGYKFEELTPHTYLIKASKMGFLSQKQSVSLGMGETKELDFTLLKVSATAVLRGTVSTYIDRQSRPLREAQIVWKGPAEGSVLTGAEGRYEIKDLPLGSYTLIASKRDYSSAEENVIFTLAGEEKEIVFVLEPVARQGIKGCVYIDENNNQRGEETEKTAGASLYVDGTFRGYSQRETGCYELNLEAGEHEISAAYQGYEAEPEKIIVVEGRLASQDLLLTKYVSACQGQAVEDFSLSPSPGKKEVKLEWRRPCPDVASYQVYKYYKDELVDDRFFSPAQSSYTDKEVEWGETYQYGIKAVYTGGGSEEALIYSEPTAREITLGDPECEGKYLEALGRFSTFCLIAPGQRQQTWSCTLENELYPEEDCSRYQEGEYCAPVSASQAICKNTGNCDWTSQAADLFGLYYEKQRCYYGLEGGDTEIDKSKTKNYCYFDYTPTIVDKCGSCTEINSCFGYQSRDACEINNCLGSNCQWTAGASHSLVDYSLAYPDLLFPLLVSEETGHGYCTEKEYKDDDRCELCSSQAELFENYFCTAEICAALGQCFSADELSRCEKCGEEPTSEVNCYTYSTELECTGGLGENSQPLEVDELGEVTFSKDRCGWGRCRWQGNPGGAGKCVKDGDDDKVEDCEHLPSGQSNCRRDNEAPFTRLPEGFKVISLAYPTLTFYSKNEEGNLAVLGYCLDLAEASAQKCTKFQEVGYPQKSREGEVKVNLAESLGEESGETYRLRFYSEDEYSNRESVKETFVFVDTKPPYFEINNLTETRADTTDLTIFLEGLDELAACTLELTPIWPHDEKQSQTLGKEEQKKEAIFSGLKGISYHLLASCADDYGNMRNDTMDYVFDLEQGIDILSPRGAVNKREIVFAVETLVGSRCELYKTETSEKITDFSSKEEKYYGEGKYHETSPLPGFIEGNYPATYKVVCTELLNPDQLHEDYFNFVVDFTSPTTQIILQEGEREERPLGDNWKESFVENVLVSLECQAEGFACSQSYYCLTEKDYEPRHASCYKEYTQPWAVDNSTSLCYYSVDEGGNRAYPTCGKISIEGYGITLVQPPLYWYEEEQWGISSQPNFDWEILTKVPTQECKFDWLSDFDYEAVPDYHLLSPGEKEDHYLFFAFPGEIISPYPEKGGLKTLYVKCLDEEGRLGPAQKINLEYDPSAPLIKEAYARPNPVYEGRKTNLFVKTDDKTLCKFDEGESEYSTMRYTFPAGPEENILEISHEAPFTISFSGTNKSYAFKTQCKNGAETFSEIRDFSFFVDYSALGNILGLEPSGYLATKNITLKAFTSKNARCEYDGKPFSLTGGTEHQQSLSGLSEGEYHYLVSCLISGERREGEINFVVDLTSPEIKEIKDGKISCSLAETPQVYVYTNEKNLTGYYYELYDKAPASASPANRTSSIRNQTSNTLIANGTLASYIPFRLRANLTTNHTYFLKIKALDAAGNWGKALKESDGFLAVPAGYSKCEEDQNASKISFIIDNNASCSYTEVEIYCDDETSCDIFNYGESFVSTACSPAKNYLGQKLLFEKSGWLCYYTEDAVGNNQTGLKKIEFKDEDGDGITDRCDQCPETEAGALVDDEGCSSEEGTKDTDGDQLPDYWEKMYDAEGCELDYTRKDSNGDGTFDTDEDYDKDSYLNYDEYRADSDPCLAEPPEKPVEVKAKEEVPPEKEAKVLAWLFLILGLLLVLGGSGYLVYYYKFGLRPPALVSFRPEAFKPAEKAAPPAPWKERLLALMKAKTEREKARQREVVFGAFTRESKEIPHLENILFKKKPSPEKLAELAGKYVEKKEEIQPGLRPEEKNIFAQLENIAKQAKEKKAEKIVSQEEAQNIFEKLKEINRKRKEKK